MLRSRILLMLLAMLPGAWLGAQVGPDPRENSFQFFVDGAVVQGVIGYRIEFNHDPQTRTDSRQLNTAYSPDQRRLAVTVTQKGLNRLQVWLNDATANDNPVSKAVAIVAASTDKQHFWFRAFELADSFLLVPHRAVGTKRPVLPSTVGTDGPVATSDQLLVDRGFTGTG